MLQRLSENLAKASSPLEKMAILDRIPAVETFQKTHPSFAVFLEKLSLEGQIVVKQLVAMGQIHSLAPFLDEARLFQLLEKLLPIDHFYREIGGIAGYQAQVMQLIEGKTGPSKEALYHSPSFLDIAEETPFVEEAVLWGIEHLGQMGEIYPLGGAADRLHLVDEATGMELPAAKLPFAGKTLLEHLIRDLQAREFLHFQLFGKQLITPIAIMTSHEKNNHLHVQQICEQFHYFGRPKESIRFFTQPLVPAVDMQGNWCVTGPFKPLWKPGGHGVLWKLAKDQGIFDWLTEMGKSKLLIRQINNPIAGLDYGLLAFTGIGCHQEMVFGFASCPRLLQAAEGVNVVIEKEGKIVLTNIEYCDFAKFGIEDLPLKQGEPYSRFSSNTNILFADLKAVSEAVEVCPFPGLLLNLKKTSYLTETGEKKEEPIARLESTMQNIADVFTEEKKESLKTERTFVTYNHRHKTISTAKKAFVSPLSLQETPENCFYDLWRAHRSLLLSCGFELPAERSLQESVELGPEALFLYHPGLGPLYKTIRKKLRGGWLGLGSELCLEVADLSWSQVEVNGSLQIFAEQILGARDEQNLLRYSDQVGRCILENVTIGNKGVDWSQSAPFWRMNLHRQESVKIILKGKSTFIARNIKLQGSHTFVVEDGCVMEL